MIELKDFSQRALRRISPIYDNSDFVKHLFNSIASDYDLLRALFKSLRQQSFIDTVDWGIEYQELKYSLPIREDLPLEERRKLLGIRAQIHRPLNPARLELAIKKAYDTDVYLYEKDSGYIKIYTNQYGGKFNQIVDFLKVEKPAHLLIGWYLNLVEYIGEGERRRIIYTPGMTLELPKSEADKKNYPRISTGIGKIFTGFETVGLRHIENIVSALNVGGVKILTGALTVQTFRASQAVNQLSHTSAQAVTGEVTIDAVSIDPLLIQPLGDDQLRFYFSFPISRHKTIRGFTIGDVRTDVTRAEIADVANFIVNNNILLNEAGESVNGDLGAAFKTKQIVKTYFF